VGVGGGYEEITSISVCLVSFIFEDENFLVRENVRPAIFFIIIVP